MHATKTPIEAPIERLEVAAYTIPTDAPEADGTIAWDSTTMVTVHVRAAGATGFGYTYAGSASAEMAQTMLANAIQRADAMAIPRVWQTMLHTVRNTGRPGVGAMAISAIDNALWDLKGKLLGLPVAVLLGRARDSAPVYGSGGFTSYDDAQLERQLAGWARDGIRFVKMKVGTNPGDDPRRVHVARRAIGAGVALFVDANGAYTAKQALALAQRFAQEGVTWFEEPVSSDDLPGLRFVRERTPAGMDVAAGEYGFDPWYFQAMLAAGAVDVLQADATRCCGITGFMRAAALADAFQAPLSSHCAPAIHCAPACAAPRFAQMEYFHDHVRIEAMMLDGAPELHDGNLWPRLDRPGLGFELKQADAERYRSWP